MSADWTRIHAVVPGSLAEEVGIRPGFLLKCINEQPIGDIVDYRYAVASELVVLQVQDLEGVEWELEIEKDFEEDLGLVFAEPTISPLKACRNNCRFCFVQQLPGGMRPTLRIKDDDYRLSALQGSFVTLTNLSGAEWQRILNLRLSPLYISVHTTNGPLRAELMRNPAAARIMEQLRELAENQIEMHCQIVLVPGVNDGPELEKTVHDLLALWPAVQSVAVVPVGLTRHRERLDQLDSFDRPGAEKVLDYLLPLAEELRRERDTSFVYAADEFFVLTERQVPESSYYDGFPQLENGVGLIRLLLEQAEEGLMHLPQVVDPARAVIWVTGLSAVSTLSPLAERLNQVSGLKVEVVPVANRRFGESITVAGLLTGEDIRATLQEHHLAGKIVMVPDVAVRMEEKDFLDDMPFAALRSAFPEAMFLLTPTNGHDLVRYTLGEGGD